MKHGHVAVIGPTGMLGKAVLHEFDTATAITHKELDITDKDAVLKVIKQYDVVINCSGYTNVDKAEDERDKAYALNVVGPMHLAAACKEIGATFVQISSDFVFDGTNTLGYDEHAQKSPVNYYGYTKSACEDEIVKINDKTIIVRTQRLFGPGKRNLISALYEVVTTKESGQFVSDQIFAPTSVMDLAKVLPDIVNRQPGIYHYTSKGMCSILELAQYIGSLVGSSCAMMSVRTEQFEHKAARPHYSILLNTKLEREIPHWKSVVKTYVEELHEHSKK